MKKRFFSLGLSGALLAGMVCAHTFSNSVSAQETPTKTPQPANEAPAKLEMGLVDYNQIVKQHPDYDKIVQIDEQINKLEGEAQLIAMSEERGKRISAEKTMRDAMEKARWELEAEKSAVESQLRGVGNALTAQAQAEVERLQRDAMNQIKPELDKLRGDSSVASVPDSGAQTGGEYMENLRIIRSRNVTARRLELEKAMGGEIQAEQARLEGQLSAYVDSVAAKYQEEKINLQLKHQISQDEAEKQKIEERLNVISEEVDTAKATKRQEVAADMSKFRNEKQAAFESANRAYEAKLDAEIRTKAPGLLPRPQQPQRREMPAEARAKIQEMENKIKSQMAGKRAEIEARMAGEQATATARLKQKQADVQARLKVVQDELMKQMSSRSKFLSKATQAKLDAAKKKLETAENERKQLVDHIKTEVDGLVGEVAKKQNIPTVIHQPYLHIYGSSQPLYRGEELVDLTDLSMVAVKQIKRPE